MRHRKRNRLLGRQRSHYKATLRHLVRGLIENKRIVTTKAKAKEASRLAEKLVTMGKKKSISSQRKVYSVLGDRNLVAVLFSEIAPLFKDRNGGYTRVILTGRRRGDNAQMAILEFVEKPKEERKKEKPAQPRSEAKIKKVTEKEDVKRDDTKKEVTLLKRPEKPKLPREKPGFFKRFFKHKREK